MNPILGHIIAIVLLAIPVYFAARYWFRDIKNALTNGSCGDCGGNCSHCSGSCASCKGCQSAGGTKNSC